MEDEEICDHIAAHTAVVLARQDLIHAEVVRRNYRAGIVFSHHWQQFSCWHAKETLVIEAPEASVSLAKRSQPVQSAKAPRLKKAMEQISWVAPSGATVLVQENRGPVALQNSSVYAHYLAVAVESQRNQIC